MNYRHKATGIIVTLESRNETSVYFRFDGVSALLAPSEFDAEYELVVPDLARLLRYRNRGNGAVVEVLERRDGLVYFAAQGGGFRRVAAEERFKQDFEPTLPQPFVRGTVTADWLPDGVCLPCISDGDCWNGWAMPHFDRAAVNQLMALCPGLLRWKDDREQVVVPIDTGDDAGEEWAPECLMLAGGEIVEAWGIGAGSWCWEGFEPDQEEPVPPTDTQMLDWLFAHPYIRVRGNKANGYAVMDCSDGLVILADGDTERAAIAAAMNKEKGNGN